MDALLVPTVPIVPTTTDVEQEPVEVNATMGRFTSFTNLGDLCAVAVPAPATDDPPAGLGVMLVAPAWHDSIVVSIAALAAR